jgi:hypothetical protein
MQRRSAPSATLRQATEQSNAPAPGTAGEGTRLILRNSARFERWEATGTVADGRGVRRGLFVEVPPIMY